jgi:hypothetical protein
VPVSDEVRAGDPIRAEPLPRPVGRSLRCEPVESNGDGCSHSAYIRSQAADERIAQLSGDLGTKKGSGSRPVRQEDP